MASDAAERERLANIILTTCNGSNDCITKLRAWYDARDVFFGLNYTKQDLVRGYDMASACHHEDAVWLCSIVTRDDVLLGDRHLRSKFISDNTRQTRRGRSITFAALVTQGRALPYNGFLIDAAKVGYAFAQNVILEKKGTFGWTNEQLDWAHNAASSMEPFATYALSVRSRQEDAAQVALLALSAKLGCVEAMRKHTIDNFDEWNPMAFTLLAQLTNRGCHSKDFFRIAYRSVDSYRCGDVEYSRATYEIGRLIEFYKFEGRILESLFHIVNQERTTWARTEKTFDFAVDFYSEQKKITLRSVHMWSLVARRFKVVKDIRLMVAKMIWNDRGHVTDLDTIKRLNMKKKIKR